MSGIGPLAVICFFRVVRSARAVVDLRLSSPGGCGVATRLAGVEGANIRVLCLVIARESCRSVVEEK